MSDRHRPLSNVNAEMMLLGALLNNPHSFWDSSGVLRSDHFSEPIHRQIFSVIRDIMDEQKKLTLPLLTSRLPEEDAGGQDMAAYLSALIHNAVGLNASDFADEVAEMASRRKLDAVADRIKKKVKGGLDSSTDIAGEAEATLLDVMQLSSPKRPKRLSTLADSVIMSSGNARDQDVLPGFGTGILSIDEILGLILPADLGFILGAQGDGKTSLAAQIGVHVSHYKPVLFFSHEMTDEGLAAREVAAASGVSVREVHEGSFDFAAWDRIKASREALARPEFWILDDKKLTIRQIRSHCLAMKRSIGLGLVIIDQLDKVKGEGRHRDRWERTAEVTNDAKDLMKELEVAGIFLAQRTRTSQRRDDSTPQIDDADAPTIERDGDWVMAVWQKANWLRRNKPNAKAGGEAWDKWEAEVRRCKGVADIIVLKHRRKEAFEQRSLKWIGSLTRFAELTE